MPDPIMIANLHHHNRFHRDLQSDGHPSAHGALRDALRGVHDYIFTAYDDGDGDGDRDVVIFSEWPYPW